MDVAHPLEISLGVVFRREFNLASFHGFNRAIGQWLNLDEPLRGKPGLNDGLAPITLADGKRMVLDSPQADQALPDRAGFFPVPHNDPDLYTVRHSH